MVASLRVTGAGNDHVVTGGELVTIGRDPDSTIPVEGDGVSRQHARIRLSEGRWVLEDVGSRFGTFHEGSQVERIAIDGPTTVRLGDGRTGLEVVLTPAEPVQPSSPRPVSAPVQTQGPDALSVGTLRNVRSVHALSLIHI